MRIVDAEIKGNRTLCHFILFSLSFLLLTGCSSAQCGNCDDNNPCTRDWCNGTQCLHESQICDQSGTMEIRQETTDEGGPIGFAPAYGTEDDKSIMSPRDALFDPSSISVPDTTINCDDSNPCTRDYPRDEGCHHEAISCDDGDSSTIDTCGPSGCINNPAPSLEENRLPKPIRQSILLEQITNETDAADGKSDVRCEDCDDGNESTMDYCQDGDCIHRPVGGNENKSEILAVIPVAENLSSSSQNNSTALSAGSSSLRPDRHKCKDNEECNDRNPCTNDACIDGKCRNTPIDCDDNDSSTNDYCYGGNCYHTTLDCNVSDNCYIGTFDGKKCIKIFKCSDGDPCTIDRCDHGRCYYQSKCDDRDPCTIDRCDRRGHCTHSPVVCRDGKTCIHGTCQYSYYYPYYPYYSYYPYGVPYVPPTPTAPAPAPSKPQSYTIPAGTSITLPWGGSMLSAEVLQVYNGLAYPEATPISFTRDLGSPAQIASIGQVALSAMNQWEMIGLSWKDAAFKLTLVQPNKIVLPAQGDGRNVVHLTGSKYDYYFLKSPPAGDWTVQIMPVNAATSGTGYSLLSGLVQGAIPPNQA